MRIFVHIYVYLYANAEKYRIIKFRYTRITLLAPIINYCRSPLAHVGFSPSFITT